MRAGRSVLHPRMIQEELDGFSPRIVLFRVATAWLPPFVGLRLRAALLRRLGFSVGRGTVLFGSLRLTGPRGLRHDLHIGRHCIVNLGCHLEVHAPVFVGDGVSIGQEVMVLTNAHRVGRSARRAGPIEARPVRIEDGAWLSTRCTVLPGVTIGAGAVVAAGAVVHRDVEPNTLVGGVPARLLARLDPEGDRLPAAATVGVAPIAEVAGP